MRFDSMMTRLGVMAWAALILHCGGHRPSSATCSDVLPKSCPAAAPSYKADVTPILASRCLQCHQAGGQAAYMLLDTYDNVFRHKQSVLSVLNECIMPPDAATQPTDTERAAVMGWIVCGAAND